MNLAPIVLFTYNRLEATKKTIEALQLNFLAKKSHLIIFSDGYKNESDYLKVTELRQYLKNIDGFASIEIKESIHNKGLADSIISGVTEIINKHGKVIVLEDDLVTTPNFLNYMNQCLDFYEEEKQIISICGFGLKIKKDKNELHDVYAHGRSSSWGWATWKDRWETIDWEVKDWENIKNNKKIQRAFNVNGSDLYSMLRSVKEGKGKSWAIRFCYSQFKQKKNSIFPYDSLVQNIGFNADGSNTKHQYSRFKTILDDGIRTDFNLKKPITNTAEIDKMCYYYHSIPIRIYSRFRYFIGF
ncbi:glycosyl transferase [Cloacibacterium rupense]|uniref:Glycosyl transferase n=1 Tax=Cloacibacterium rupense TaxID=517423 RepID=A0ABQ2NFP5_9FLAO|nr:sugar transferase [Cloacibacterium rupense]GGP01716.1 glycosyl transferase [Cloacibacterium rupense]